MTKPEVHKSQQVPGVICLALRLDPDQDWPILTWAAAISDEVQELVLGGARIRRVLINSIDMSQINKWVYAKVCIHDQIRAEAHWVLCLKAMGAGFSGIPSVARNNAIVVLDG